MNAAAVARWSETSKEFDGADGIVALFPEDIGISLELRVDIVEVASCGLCE